MRNVNSDTITDAVIRSFVGIRPARQRALLSALVRHLHDLVRETELTHAEWSEAVAFITRCGAMTNEERSEFALLSDVLGISSLVDLVDAPEGMTEGSVLGPFYASDSPERPVGADLRPDGQGEPLLVSGTVSDVDGRPVTGAAIDIWQTAENGLYATQDVEQPNDALRCKMVCTEHGQFAFTTVRPGPYKVPEDGPVGYLLRAAGRTAWRPAHFHFLVMAPGHRKLTTEVFFEGDKWLEKDAVFGVRESLIVPIKNIDGQRKVDLLFRLAKLT